MSITVLCPANHSVVIPDSKLGKKVLCPRCQSSFVAEAKREAARPAKGKARPAPDDDEDDEEDEDEKPRKKAKGKPAKKSEDEKPRAKKRARDEDDEVEDSEPLDEEEPIKWTPKKRQLQVVSNGLMCYQIGFWLLYSAFVIDGLGMLLVVAAMFMKELLYFGVLLWIFLMFPLLGASLLVQLVGWIMCLWGPSKAELRSSIITAILFLAGPTLLYLIFLILQGADFFRNAEVESRFSAMMMTGAEFSILVSFFSGLQVLSKIATFFGQSALSKEPVTLGWFIIGGILIRTLVFAVVLWLETSQGSAFSYPFGLPVVVYFFVLVSLKGLIKLVQTERELIRKFIRDE